MTSSNITSPANGVFLQATDDQPSPTMLTVTGTSNGDSSDTVDIDCWSDDGYNRTLDTTSVNSDGSFSDTSELSNIEGRPCRLRAQPGGSEDAAFTGPRIAVGEFDTYSYLFGSGPNMSDPYDFRTRGVTFTGTAHWNSLSSCGVELATFDASYSPSDPSFYCAGTLYGDDGISRSEIQVDGSNAYGVRAAVQLFGDATSGLQPLTVANNFNSSNGFESTTETDPLVECPAPDAYQPSSADCPSFSSAGVTLQRQTKMLGSNQVEVTDTWSSTNSSAHTVSAEYDDVPGDFGGGTGYEFPGQSSFSHYTTGDVIGGPASAPGSVLVHNDVSAVDGDPDEQYGAITFASAPSQFEFTNPDEFFEQQTLNVPAGGSASLTYIYSTGTTAEGVQALALAAEDQLKSPHVSISSPSNGSKTRKKTITVSGTATAGSGIRSLSVNGHAASVSSNGSWSTSVPLARGTITLTATATSNSGLSARASVNVFDKGCVAPRVKGLTVSKAKKKIKHAGCTLGKVKKLASKVTKGHAVATKPKKGKKRKPGAKVTLYVSKGP